jgi:hypothetical protein
VALEAASARDRWCQAKGLCLRKHCARGRHWTAELRRAGGPAPGVIATCPGRVPLDLHGTRVGWVGKWAGASRTRHAQHGETSVGGALGCTLQGVMFMCMHVTPRSLSQTTVH